MLVIALCQGAALHFLNGKNGVKDFDIWYFYAEDHKVKYPYRWVKSVDSKLRKFGVSRRVDLLGRSIICKNVSSAKRHPLPIIREYLGEARTQTAQQLAKKPVIGLWPKSILGKVIWP